ncbi:MAG: hypothetical protein ACRCYK_01380 [Aeromonas hydrophila]
MSSKSQYPSPREELLPPTSGLIGSKFVSPNISVSPASLFGDPSWNMSALVSAPGIGDAAKFWNFESVPGYPCGFSLSLAEYAYARLYKPVATHDRAGEWLTVNNELYILKSFAQYCGSQGLNGFHEVDNQLLSRYLKSISFSNCKTDGRIIAIFRIIYRLWEYRSQITTPLTEKPFNKPFEKMFIRKKDSESPYNKTLPIPEPIYSAIMSTALDYVLKYSKILLETWESLQSIWEKEVIHLNLSDNGKAKRFNRKATKIIRKINSYWRISPMCSHGDLYDELHQLRSACILIILAYSGIRPSELLSLTAGCYISDVSANGQPIYYINTLLHKHRGGGCKDSWVVIEEVVVAIKILEILTKQIRDAAGNERLFLTDRSSGSFNIRKTFVGKQITEFTTGAISYQINRFQKYCNQTLHYRPIPEWLNEAGTTEPWHFNLRQFRRTLARYIARQPFGIIAGMLQYKHLEVAIFEGYAGEEPEWNKLLEQEKILASIDILGELAIDLSEGMVAGEFGISLKSAFNATFRGRVEDYPPSQIVKWLAHSNKQLFVGKFNFCFFDPAKAICTSNNTLTDRPVLNFCQPGQCSNACISKRHKLLWEAQLSQAKEFAIHPKASKLQKHQLQIEIIQLEAVINELGASPDA